jgi:hypothetical protein
MDWFKGQFAGKPHDLHGKIDGFRLRFSQQNQSIDGWERGNQWKSSQKVFILS